MPLKAVLFDFDFTLADSADAVMICMAHAFAARGLPAPDRAAVERTIGLTLPEAFGILAPGADPGDLFRLFVAKADEVMVAATRLFPEVPEVAAALRDLGLGLGIVSTKYRYRIEAILARGGLLDRFDLIVGYEDVRKPKPDPEGVLFACGKLKASPAEVLYIGDSLVDAETAVRAGTAFAAVLHGRTTPAEFAPYRPLAVLGDLRGLLDLVKDLLAA